METMNPSRRSFLAAAPALALPAVSMAQAASRSSRILEENAKPGTTDWQLTRVLINKGKYRSTLIEGYALRQSIRAGETLEFFVSTDPARLFTIDLYRLGYYGGKGGRHLAQLGPFEGSVQPTPEMKPENRLRECRWEASASLEIPGDWPSGIYLGKLTTIPESESDPYWQSYIIFVVRDEREADIIFQTSDNTSQAYNRWPRMSRSTPIRAGPTRQVLR